MESVCKNGGGGVPAGHIGCRRAGQQKGVLIFFHTIWELNCRVWAAHAAYIWSGHSGLWPCAHHQVLFSCLAKYKSLVLLYYTGLVFNMEKTRRFFWGQGWVMLSVLQMYFSLQCLSGGNNSQRSSKHGKVQKRLNFILLM